MQFSLPALTSWAALRSTSSLRESSSSLFGALLMLLICFPGFGARLLVGNFLKSRNHYLNCSRHHPLKFILDGETSDDQFLTHRLDLIFFGLHYQARALCVQYGDGIANNFFWRSDLYWFNLLRKVKTWQTWNDSILHIFSTSIASSHVKSQPQPRVSTVGPLVSPQHGNAL